ncbi:flavin reductase family protein [Gordonia sp. X0973]|uniref:flavin reductase family protein n=1 Tax=Gordonia sp. X0973 TaxID=2742602 RepID=UPI000F520A06|nr:flavin reductase family protein [Gordonia sp. X0973]QKT09024.1 flavin reductase family protein [Gordonia sp. X0973]
MEPADSADALRRAFSCFPTGVVAVCAHRDGTEFVGMAASSFSTVSLTPPLVSVCVQNSSRTWPLLRDRSTVGVSVFAHDQAQLCRQLAGPAAQRFADVELLASDDGALFVDGAAAHLACELHAEYPAGDHTVVLLRIRSLAANPEVDPLVFHASTFRAFEAPPIATTHTR